jgi:hypothetical protein
MGIVVNVRTESGAAIGESLLVYRPLVSWVDRSTFPLLGHVDPYGDTVLNRSQVESLQSELSEIAAMIDSSGIRSFVSRFGADSSNPEPTTSSALAEEWIPQTMADLGEMCTLAMLRPHRYLWFSGD